MAYRPDVPKVVFLGWLAFGARAVRNVALPYIDECRANCPFPDSPVFYSFDGEAKVMNPMLAPDLIPLCSQRKVLMVKHAGSTSALCNACDAGNMHKATKTSVKHANEESLMGSISGAEPSIEAAFLQHSTGRPRPVVFWWPRC